MKLFDVEITWMERCAGALALGEPGCYNNCRPLLEAYEGSESNSAFTCDPPPPHANADSPRVCLASLKHGAWAHT